MKKLAQLWPAIVAGLGTFLVGLAVYLGLRDNTDDTPTLTDYDPVRNLIDAHFDELSKLQQDKTQIKKQRQQIEASLNRDETKEFYNAIGNAVAVNDHDELQRIRKRYLAKYDFFRAADAAKSQAD